MAEKATKTFYVKDFTVVYEGTRYEIGDEITLDAAGVANVGKECLSTTAPKKEDKK